MLSLLCVAVVVVVVVCSHLRTHLKDAVADPVYSLQQEYVPGHGEGEMVVRQHVRLQCLKVIVVDIPMRWGIVILHCK